MCSSEDLFFTQNLLRTTHYLVLALNLRSIPNPPWVISSLGDLIIKRQGTGSLGTEKWITPCLRNNSHHLFGVDFSKVIPNCRTECFSVKNTQEARNRPPRGFTNSVSGKLASESIRKLRPASTLPGYALSLPVPLVCVGQSGSYFAILWVWER